MKKTNKVIIAHVITWICIMAAGTLLYYLISNALQFEQFHLSNGEGTRFDFIIDSGTEVGFNRETIIYTENGINSIMFSGKIGVEGTAEISVVSDDDSGIVYSETYSNVKAQTIDFEVTDLVPYSYYTLRFSSDDAKSGKLTLVTDQKLVKQPERPERPIPSIPNK
ncbi:hypothetical protein [Lacrimispora brassicae]